MTSLNTRCCPAAIEGASDDVDRGRRFRSNWGRSLNRSDLRSLTGNRETVVSKPVPPLSSGTFGLGDDAELRRRARGVRRCWICGKSGNWWTKREYQSASGGAILRAAQRRANRSARRLIPAASSDFRRWQWRGYGRDVSALAPQLIATTSWLLANL